MEWGKKLVIALISIIVLSVSYFITLFKAPALADWKVFATILGLIVGGFFGFNEASKFIKSKWFHPELTNKKKGG